MKPKYPKMPPKPKTREEALELENLKLRAENAILKKVAGAQPTKNAEKAAIVKVLRMDFPLQILLDLLGLARSVFFYHLKEKIDKDDTISQEIMRVYRDNHECYGYRRITT